MPGVAYNNVGMQGVCHYSSLPTPLVDVDSETDSNHDTALTLACAGGHDELAQLLLTRGANIGLCLFLNLFFFFYNNFY